MSTGSTTTASTTPDDASRAAHDDRQYDDFRRRMQARFLANLSEGAGRLFTTDVDADALWAAYLDGFPEGAERQYHTCHACRQFLATYGSLVMIDEAGSTRPAIWHEDDAPEAYRPVVAAIARIVRKARVTGVFLSSETTWGKPVTGVWTHYAVTPPDETVYKTYLRTAGQAMAEKREDFRAVSRALAEFVPSTIDQALRLLESDTLYRSEKVFGPAKWLGDIHAARDGIRGPAKDNIVWRAVASAPPGFCHPRSSMIGTLLEDIAEGMAFAEVSRRFSAKMHPLQYQRPQAAPSAGNIAAAEKIVETLGIARSLERRFARLDEVQAIWKPAMPSKGEGTGNSGGVFAHLAPKGEATVAQVTPPAITMTWEKFTRTVLPTAQSIEYRVPAGPTDFTALLTAVHADAPPILQWDREDRRNPVSWYVWMGGSLASQWGLDAGQFRKVTAITTSPAHWGNSPTDFGSAHHGQSAIFLLDGAKDSRMDGNAIFPETLKSELHAVRSTIEAYSKAAKIEGGEEASACGVMLGKGDAGQKNWDATFRVHSGGGYLEYRLDRWD